MLGVVADDTTGANDIGLMFSKNNYTAKVVTFNETISNEADADVLIIDTDSRLDEPEKSYQKVYDATKILQDMGCRFFFNKTCSVFRGNIGKEFDAMLDALDEEFAVISLAFPKNGRKTINGIHTVHGKLLEQSEFAIDPVHPMLESNLVEILQKQTTRRVTMIPLEVVRKGSIELRNEIELKRKSFHYCIVDSETQTDLAVVAGAVHDLPVICGSSAIAEELPKFFTIDLVPSAVQDLNFSDSNVLIVSGSLTPQTRGQTAHLKEIGTPTIVLDSLRVFSSEEREKEVRRVSLEAIYYISNGIDVLLMADNREEIIAETKAVGEKFHFNELTTSKMISAALADATGIIVKDTGLRRLVVAGGDTSGTVCRRLGITGNYILKEIETGLPSGLTLDRNMLIVLKSGSFGKPEFLETAVKHLKEF